MSWYSHYACREAPFSKEIPDTELWTPPSLTAIVDSLDEAIRQRQSAFLVADSGFGKTCLLRALRQRLLSTSCRLTYCHNATLGRRDFYRQLCHALGLAPSATAAAVFNTINQHVETLARDRVHPVFVLDEAHLLHQDTLDHLHILMNYDFDSRALLSLILVGLPELELRLGGKHNRALYTRLHVRIRVPALTVADSEAYLAYRLTRVGARADVFQPDAIDRLHDATQGGMRELDRIATDALKLGAERRRPRVDAQTVDDVIDRLELPRSPR